VYLIGSLTNKKLITYVGWSHDVVKRIKNHNLGKGAKFTKGRQWFLIYKKSFLNKKNAMKAEYKLKTNRKLRKNIINKFISK
jgi:putative endonuclease